jgi:hypothetical protein
MSGHNTQYEKSDIHVGVVAWTVVGVIILCLVTVFSMKSLFQYDMKNHSLMEDVTLEPGKSRFKVNESFPEPRLQYDVVTDMKNFLKHERQWLGSYGWVNKDQGVARIPVDSAIDLYLSKLPQGASPAEAKPQ